MEFKGTKGKWLLNDTDNEIFGGEDNYNSISSGKGYYDKYENKQSGFNLSGYISKENAKLIVSSPDLLECLQGLSDAISNGNSKKISEYNLKSKKLIKNICQETA